MHELKRHHKSKQLQQVTIFPEVLRCFICRMEMKVSIHPFISLIFITNDLIFRECPSKTYYPFKLWPRWPCRTARESFQSNYSQTQEGDCTICHTGQSACQSHGCSPDSYSQNSWGTCLLAAQQLCQLIKILPYYRNVILMFTLNIWCLLVLNQA